MIFIVLSLSLIILAIVERYLNQKRKDIWDKYKIFLGATFLVFLFLLSYFVTDTFIGLVNIFALTLLFSFVNLLKDSRNKERYRMIGYLLGLPFLTLLMILAIRNSLTNFRFIYLILFILNMITAYPNKGKTSKKENIYLVGGGIISLGIIFSFSKGPEADYIVLSRQEVVAKAYVEERYGESDTYVYITWSNINLRNQDIEVRAFGPNNPSFKLIYNNGKIKETSSIK